LKKNTTRLIRDFFILFEIFRREEGFAPETTIYIHTTLARSRGQIMCTVYRKLAGLAISIRYQKTNTAMTTHSN
jgi:hypothetical protein